MVQWPRSMKNIDRFKALKMLPFSFPSFGNRWLLCALRGCILPLEFSNKLRRHTANRLPIIQDRQPVGPSKLWWVHRRRFPTEICPSVGPRLWICKLTIMRFPCDDDEWIGEEIGGSDRGANVGYEVGGGRLRGPVFLRIICRRHIDVTPVTISAPFQQMTLVVFRLLRQPCPIIPQNDKLISVKKSPNNESWFKKKKKRNNSERSLIGLENWSRC